MEWKFLIWVCHSCKRMWTADLMSLATAAFSPCMPWSHFCHHLSKHCILLLLLSTKGWVISKARTNGLYLVKTNAASQYSGQSKKLLHQLHLLYVHYVTQAGPSNHRVVRDCWCHIYVHLEKFIDHCDIRNQFMSPLVLLYYSISCLSFSIHYLF